MVATQWTWMTYRDQILASVLTSVTLFGQEGQDCGSEPIKHFWFHADIASVNGWNPMKVLDPMHPDRGIYPRP